MLYTNQEMSDPFKQKLNALRMKYPRLYWTSELSQIKLFCAMAPMQWIKEQSTEADFQY